MFAELVINIEAPLEGAFHYNVPADLQARVQVGQLVEVEFGRRLAQATIIRLTGTSPIPDTKPIIAIIDVIPVVRDYQIAAAQWMSATYFTPLNACLRLFLPPGLTRWSDITVDIHPYWDGNGRLTEAQQAIIDTVREQGDMRGNKLKKALPKPLRPKMKEAIRQLVRRNILVSGSVLEPPRIRPKNIHTAVLLTDPHKIRDAVVTLGRRNKAADILNYLALTNDPLPAEAAVLQATGATKKHLKQLESEGLVEWVGQQTITIESPDGSPHTLTQAATVGLAVRQKQVLGHILHLRGAEKYHAVLQFLAEMAQPVPLKEITFATGASRAQLNKLAKLELIRYAPRQVWRDSLADRDFVSAEPPLLTDDQARVWGRIKMMMIAGSEAQDPHRYQPLLLHGVTGSGKTEIYMRAIDHAIENGQTAMVLVPEIALTPQTVRRFAARFPGRVAVLHSRLSDGERYDTWRRARLGLFDIIVGPRSALFTPLANVGVIVLDEEHDASYKQTPPVPAPYYHARDAAIALGDAAGALVILGSATPDIVSYHRAKAGNYTLMELPKRVMGHRKRIESAMERIGRTSAFTLATADPDDALTIELPPVKVVDLRQELRAGNRTVFSRVLQTELDGVLARKEQAILFLNRRGSATYVFCRDCGHVKKCPNCDLPLTYHRPHSHLICHQCRYNEPPPDVCPDCASRKIKYFGLGTQQLEELVQARWPQARTVRWDKDTTKGRDKHEELLASFINHESDILIGTQMIAKGLDMPLVTLVGVISADVSLGLPDFRTGERTFQVLTQVAGRAGRGLLGGRVIFQTYNPEHYAIAAASQHDYAQFYVDEISFRTQQTYPPFRRMAKLVYADPSPVKAEQEAIKMAAHLRELAYELELNATEIIGPVPPFFGRIDRRFRWQIIIRASDPGRLLRDVKLPPRWMLDVDPVSTL